MSMESKKIALITGITGQDGSYLAEFLIEKGYEVHGLMRRSSSFNTARIEHLYLDEWVRDMKKARLVNLHWADMTDSSSLVRVISKVRPTEIYNLAAQSHVKVSFDVPEYTADTDANGVLRLLEAVRICGLADTCRIYQASTSELYGKVQEVPQSETTPFYPRSPYAVAKLYGFWIMKNYRESYNMFCCNGILFNHESERRGETFVTRKITLAAARIAQGYQDKLYLGNLNSLRDWGYAKDYIECMWLILQQPEPDDFVIATGEYHTVREFCTLAFKEVGIELEWRGDGVDEKGYDKATGKSLVEVDPKYFRPAEVDQLLGNPAKAKAKLGWNPQKTSFEDLVKIMVRHDMKNAIQGLDGIIYNAADDHTINDETLEQLKMAVSLLRSSLDNFAKIIPSSREQTTTLPDILVAVEMLSRYDMQQRKVTAAFDYDRNSEVPITHPFQTMVQIVDNFIINALNAFGSQADKKLHVEGVIDNDKCRIAIHDNAPHIPEADKEHIFEYGYSTTGGTGIGLFHAKSVMDEIGGSIVLKDSCFDNYTKCFIIEFPIQIHYQDNE